MNMIIDAPIYAIELSPQFEFDRLIFVASQAGLFKSNDGGASWESIYNNTPFAQDTPTTSLALSRDFAKDQTLFAAISGAIVCSYNCGKSWEISPLGLPSPIVSAICLSPNFSQDHTLFVTTLEDGVFRSKDRGKTFERCSFHLYDVHVNCITMSPDYRSNQSIWVGTEISVFHSVNGAHSWQETAFPIEAGPVLSVISHKDRLYAGTESNGVFESAVEGANWQLIPETSALREVSRLISDQSGLFVLAEDGLYHLEFPNEDTSVICLYRDESSLSVGLDKGAKKTCFIGYSTGQILNIQI